MIEEQEIINTIRSAVLDMRKPFTAFDLMELPRTGGYLKAIKAQIKDINKAAVVMGCQIVHVDTGVQFFKRPDHV